MLRRKRFLVLLGTFIFSSHVSAQTVVVTACKDSSGAELGKKTRLVLTKALKAQGIKLMEYRKYLDAARSQGISKKQARMLSGIKKLVPVLNLDGAVTSSAVKKGEDFLIAFYLYAADGQLLLKKAFRLEKPALPSKTADKLAGLMAEALGQKPPETEKAAPAPGESQPKGTAQQPSEKDKAQWDRMLASAEKQPEESEEESEEEESEEAPPGPVKKTLADAKPVEKPESGAAEIVKALPSATVTAPPPPPPVIRVPGSVPDMLLVGGLSINTRGGLSPRHEAGAFPGLRIDGRLFLGTFTNRVVLRDIGLEGMFNQSLGLKAEPEQIEDSWDASQLQWRVGLVYRLSFEEVTLSPAVLFRFGYGATRYTIEYEHPEVFSAWYTYTAGVLDIHLMPVRDLLSVYLSAGYLFYVWPSDDLSGEGTGFSVAAGVSLKLFRGLHLSLGYEQVQFLFDDRDLGETSDQFQMFYLRVGWSLR